MTTGTAGLQSEEQMLAQLARSQRRRRFRLNLEGYVLILPAILVLGIFHFLPIIYAFVLSLYRAPIFKGLLPAPERFTGFNNYGRILNDDIFWKVLGNTIWYALGSVVLGLATALGLALLLNRPIRGIGIYRTIFFLPYVTSLLVAGMIWRWLFRSPNQNGPGGLVNSLIVGVGGKPVDFLGESRGIFQLAFNIQPVINSANPEDLGSKLIGGLTSFLGGPSLALSTIILLAIWSVVGFNTVVFIAGLQNVPKELYDAARVDGAQGWTLFKNITWPLISPTTFFLAIVSTIGAFQAFTTVFTTSIDRLGGPDNSTNVMTLFFYTAAFRYTQLGLSYASTTAIILFFILVVLSIFQTRLAASRVNY